MITKNFKALMACMLQSNGSVATKGYMPVKNVSGTTGYLGFYYAAFPYSLYKNVSFSSAPGIIVGRGDTPATEDDYALESIITSGLTASNSTQTNGIDDGNPYLEYLFTLTNTTGSDIVVKEIGYLQFFQTATASGANASNYGSYLIERTVLSTPVTVPANDSAAIKYRLKTVLS